MKRKVVVSVLSSVLTGVVLLVIAVGVGAQGQPDGSPQPIGPAVLTGTPISSTFTYQGQLKSSGSAVSGPCDFQFGLWDAASVGAQVGVTQTLSAVNVANGLFTVPLDFGIAAFTGEARWLGIAVRCPAGSGNYAPLDPRQVVTPAPYAAYASGNWGLNGNRSTSAGNFLGTTDNTTLTLGVSNTAAFRIVPAVGPYSDFSPILIGGYVGNAVNGVGDGSIIAGGGSSVYGANIISGTNVVWSTISGGIDNKISDWSSFAVIAGGGHNRVDGTAEWGVIGGGESNWLHEFADHSVINGGDHNVIEYNSDHNAIGGGDHNLISGNTFNSVIGGGQGNTIIGALATIPGGYSNTAAGNQSLAAGTQAKANHTGAFVWGDSTAADFASTGNNQFLIRANGGMGVGTNAPAAQLHISSNGNGSFPQMQITQSNAADYARLRFTAGESWDLAANATVVTLFSGHFNQDVLRLTPGDPADYMTMGNGAHLTAGGVWTDMSDRNAKANFVNVDNQDILARLMKLPITVWNYKVEDPAIQHIGPMAQDFYNAFNVGNDDTHIAALDTNGVALAAIQGLAQVVADKDATIAAQQTQLVSQQTQIDSLEARLTALEQRPPTTDLTASTTNPWSAAALLLSGVIGLMMVRRTWQGGQR